MGLILPVLAFAAYNSVSLTTGTTLRTTIGGSIVDLTATGGTIESIIVNPGSVSLTLVAGSSINLTSAGKNTFTYNTSAVLTSFDCGSSSSVLSLSLPQGQATETVVVTPVNTACVVPGSTGSGGDSTTTTTTTTATTPTTTSTTSSTPSTTTTTTTTAAVVTPTATTPAPTTIALAQPSAPAVSAPVMVSVPTISIKSELNPGARSDEVMNLQRLLARDPEIYPEGTVSGFYGPKTTAAVKKFQAKYGIATVGRVGPATMAKINEVLGVQASAVAPTTSSAAATAADQIQSQIQAIQSQIQSLTSAPVLGSVTVDSELNPGTRSDEVMDLQKLLAKDPEIYPEGTVSGLYGPLTTAAVKKFQAKYGIATVGRVGPATMAKINEVLGGAAIPVAPVPVAPSTPVTSNSNDDLTKQIEAQIKAIQGQIGALTAPTSVVAPPAPTTTSTDDMAKQIEAQIKAIQDQINALQK